MLDASAAIYTLSVGPAFLITLLMLALAVASASNRTGRLRAH